MMMEGDPPPSVDHVDRVLARIAKIDLGEADAGATATPDVEVTRTNLTDTQVPQAGPQVEAVSSRPQNPNTPDTNTGGLQEDNNHVSLPKETRIELRPVKTPDTEDDVKGSADPDHNHNREQPHGGFDEVDGFDESLEGEVVAEPVLIKSLTVNDPPRRSKSATSTSMRTRTVLRWPTASDPQKQQQQRPRTTARHQRGSSAESRTLFLQYRGGSQRQLIDMRKRRIEMYPEKTPALPTTISDSGHSARLKQPTSEVSAAIVNTSIPQDLEQARALLRTSSDVFPRPTSSNLCLPLEETTEDPTPQWQDLTPVPEIGSVIKETTSLLAVRQKEQEVLVLADSGPDLEFEVQLIDKSADKKTIVSGVRISDVTKSDLDSQLPASNNLQESVWNSIEEVDKYRQHLGMLKEQEQFEVLDGAVYIPASQQRVPLLLDWSMCKETHLQLVERMTNTWIDFPVQSYSKTLKVLLTEQELSLLNRTRDRLILTISKVSGTELIDQLLDYGIICRQMLAFRDAIKALTTVILNSSTLSPRYEALWQRHLVFLSVGDESHALLDLAELEAQTTLEPRVFVSRAVIFQDARKIQDAIKAWNIYLSYCNEDLKALKRRAETHKLNGDNAAAFQDFEVLAALQPDVNLLLTCSKYHRKAGVVSKAIKEAAAAINLSPENALCYLARSKAYAAVFKIEDAIRDCSQSIHLDPVNASKAFSFRGQLLFKLQPKRALVDFSVSLMLDSDYSNIEARLYRGILYESTGQFKVAQKDFNEVVRLDAVARQQKTELASSVIAVFARCQLGLISMLHTGNLVNAILHFTRAIEMDPSYKFAYLYRAQAYKKIFESAPRGQPGPTSILILGIEDYTHVIQKDSKQPEYYVMRAKLYLELGKTAEAKNDINLAADVQPGLGNSVLVQAQLLTFMGAHDKAVTVLDSHIEMLISSPSDISSKQQIKDVSITIAESWALKGHILLKSGQYEDAIDSFENALKIQQDNTEWWYLLGLSFVYVQDDSLATEAFTCAIERDQNHYHAFYERGAALLRLNQDRGMRDVNMALSINSRFWQSYLTRACYFCACGKYRKAIQNCNLALLLEPKCVRALLTRGCLRFYLGEHSIAVQDISAAIDINPVCSIAYFNRAIIRQAMSEIELAINDYTKAIELDTSPNYIVHLNRGILYFQNHDFQRALDDFIEISDSIELSQNIFVVHAIATCRHKVGDLAGAIADFDRVLKIDDQFVEGYLARGNVHADCVNGSELGKRDYQRAIVLDPGCVQAYVDLAYILQSEGNLKAAWQVSTSALRVAPDHPKALEARAIISLQQRKINMAVADLSQALETTKSASILSSRGAANVLIGDSTNALADFHRCLDLDSQNALALYNAGIVYMKNGQLFQAIEFLDKAVEISPNEENFLVNRAIVKLLRNSDSGTLEKAFQDFTTALAVAPNTPHLILNRALVAMKLEKWEKAKVDLEHCIEVSPKDIDARALLATVYGKLDRKAEATNEYAVNLALA